MTNPVLTTGHPRPGITAAAWHSPDGGCRWRLRWEWADGPLMVFAGLNPSTADAFTSDHTAARACGFARREGCGGMAWVNLVPLITPYPAELARRLPPPSPVAPWWQAVNDQFITETVTPPGRIVVCAWGAHAAGPKVDPHRRHTLLLLARLGIPLKALALTTAGHPAHPLRLPATAPLHDYRPWWTCPGCGEPHDPAPCQAGGFTCSCCDAILRG